jgi:hypothetical protein
MNDVIAHLFHDAHGLVPGEPMGSYPGMSPSPMKGPSSS